MTKKKGEEKEWIGRVRKWGKGREGKEKEWTRCNTSWCAHTTRSNINYQRVVVFQQRFLVIVV